jgi:hypothetical protein
MAGTADDIDWIYLSGGPDPDVHVGELISVEAGGLPIYRVMAIKGGRAWLKDLQDGADRVTPLSAFHWKAVMTAPA